MATPKGLVINRDDVQHDDVAKQVPPVHVRAWIRQFGKALVDRLNIKLNRPFLGPGSNVFGIIKVTEP